MIHRFFKDRRPHHGLTYSGFVDLLERRAADVRADPQRAGHDKHARFTLLNLQRTRRIERTYSVTDRLRSVVAAVAQPQLWMVMTEPWCGDSAQNLPYIAKIADINPNIDLRILLRDEHPDIMEHYLTEGTRSIPKLVAFDLSGRELFSWGPRPRSADELFRSERASGTPMDVALEKVHRWYGTDKGKELENEFLELLAD